jgi:ComEC/Rec2-related protein
MPQGEGQRTMEADERTLLRVPSSPPFHPPAQPRAPLPVPSKERLPRPLVLPLLGRSTREAALAALREERDRGAAFLWLPVGMGAGAIVYFALPSEPPASALILGTIVLAVLAWLARARPAIRLALVAALSIVAGMLSGKTETMRTATRMLGSEVTTHLTGRVMDIERDDKGRYRLVVDVVSTERPYLRYGTDRIRALAIRVPPDLEVGDGIEGIVHLRPQSGPVRPNGYDFAFEGYFNGIGANGFFFGTPHKTAIGPPGLMDDIAIAAAKLRRALTDRVIERVGGEEGPIAAALVTGEMSAVGDDVNEAFRTSGLAHLLSISGMNLALIGGTVMFALRAIFALFPGFAARHPVKKQVTVVGAFITGIYFVISGAGIATQRSLVMLGVMFLAILFDRAAITMRNLAIATLFVVAVEPHEIVGPSFQMSFGATAALIGAYGWWSRRRVQGAARRAPERSRPVAAFLSALRFLLDVGATSLIAGVATGIFAAFHFSRLAPLGVLANLLAVPLFSFIIMPLALVAVLAIPFDLDAIPFRLLGDGITPVIRIAEHVAALTPPTGTGPMPNSVLILLSLALLVATLATTRLRLAAIPLAALGLILFHEARPPDIMVSENARLAALRMGGDVVGINTNRPDRFTLDDWQRAYRVAYVVKPDTTDAPQPVTGMFTCAHGACAAKEDGGIDVAYAATADAAADACSLGQIVILAYPARDAGCPQPGRIVVTARQLALDGALEIRLPPPSGTPEVSGQTVAGQGAPAAIQTAEMPTGPELPESATAHGPATTHATAAQGARLEKAVLTFAVAGTIDRPWHAQRQYSAAARGIDPKWRQRRNEKPAPDAPPLNSAASAQQASPAP